MHADTSCPPSSSRQSVEDGIASMDRLDSLLHVVITRMDDAARERADECDALAARDASAGPLHGITVALKDNIDTAGVRTTAGSLFFRDHVPEQDAFVVAALKRQGAILTAKVNLAEFALGATTQNAHWGSCRNAWDSTRIPGGSSGGSAVAVAAGMAVASLGTDTGGSVRIPAAVNGLVGLRPTLGRISNSGVTPISAAFDTVGPIARDAETVARVFQAIDAYDPTDPSCVDGPRQPVMAELEQETSGLVVGIPRGFFFEGLAPEVDGALRQFQESLVDLGCKLVEVDIVDAELAQQNMFKILYPDAAAFHADRMAHAPELFGAEVLDRLRLGMDVNAQEMSAALTWRRHWQRQIELLFDEVDVILSPTLAADVPLVASGAMIETTHRITRFTYPWAMFTGPSLSVPCGFHSGSGMPIGAHLTARPWNDGVLLRVAHAFQMRTDFHRAVSPLLHG
jgi:aspartyl-tRNA(Asn)/glutamyl-tRNA(Gln) amidotransferase subunit A